MSSTGFKKSISPSGRLNVQLLDQRMETDISGQLSHSSIFREARVASIRTYRSPPDPSSPEADQEVAI